MSGESVSAPPRANGRRLVLFAVIAAWAVLVVGGFATLAAYASTPGRGAVAPSTWPSGSRLARAEGRPTLLVVLHPQCSCSTATLAELRRLIHDAPSRPDVWIAFVKPDGVEADWHRTPTWLEANAIEGAHVFVDEGGEEARRFDAATSGQTLLYAADGRLLFRGGITPARGHEGDTRGRTEILSLLADETTHTSPTSVYGCPVSEDDPSGGVTR